MLNYICTCCGRKTPATTREPVCSCGGLFELDYTPPKWNDEKIDRKEWSIFRYREFMALDGDSWREVSLGEGLTPTVELKPGMFVKVDYAMPTLSFKDGAPRGSSRI